MDIAPSQLEKSFFQRSSVIKKWNFLIAFFTDVFFYHNQIINWSNDGTIQIYPILITAILTSNRKIHYPIIHQVMIKYKYEDNLFFCAFG